MQKRSANVTVWMVSLFLILAPVSPQCRTGTDQECQTSLPFIPGLINSLNGIDISRLDQSLNELMDMSKWKYSNGSCTLCDNPLLRNVQKLPLAITSWKANLSCQQKGQHLILQSEIYVAHAVTKLIVKNDWGTDLYVNSTEDSQKAFAGSEFIFTTVSKEQVLKDKFSIDKDKAVAKNFKNELRGLSVHYDDVSQLEYYNFIVKFGTHYITEYDLGASIRLMTPIPVCRIHLDKFTVSDFNKCLEIQLNYMISTDNGTNEQDLQKCNTTLQYVKLLMENDIHLIDVVGGSFNIRADLMSGVWTEPEKWLESVKTHPGLLSFSVEAIHNLVDPSDPRRRNLKQAVSDYMTGNVVVQECPQSCPSELQPNSEDSCSCECPVNNYTNSQCCPQKRGLARLMVYVLNAKRLWGDFFTQTDAYVKVSYKKKVMCTSTIWNINEPEWNATLDFGMVEITENYPEIKIQVMDDDGGPNDDLLGKCNVSLESWNSARHVCYLNHKGRLYFKYLLACAPNLGGPVCNDYFHFNRDFENLYP